MPGAYWQVGVNIDDHSPCEPKNTCEEENCTYIVSTESSKLGKDVVVEQSCLKNKHEFRKKFRFDGFDFINDNCESFKFMLEQFFANNCSCSFIFCGNTSCRLHNYFDQFIRSSVQREDSTALSFIFFQIVDENAHALSGERLMIHSHGALRPKPKEYQVSDSNDVEAALRQLQKSNSNFYKNAHIIVEFRMTKLVRKGEIPNRHKNDTLLADAFVPVTSYFRLIQFGPYQGLTQKELASFCRCLKSHGTGYRDTKLTHYLRSTFEEHKFCCLVANVKNISYSPSSSLGPIKQSSLIAQALRTEGSFIRPNYSDQSWFTFPTSKLLERKSLIKDDLQNSENVYDKNLKSLCLNDKMQVILEENFKNLRAENFDFDTHFSSFNTCTKPKLIKNTKNSSLKHASTIEEEQTNGINKLTDVSNSISNDQSLNKKYSEEGIENATKSDNLFSEAEEEIIETKSLENVDKDNEGPVRNSVESLSCLEAAIAELREITRANDLVKIADFEELICDQEKQITELIAENERLSTLVLDLRKCKDDLEKEVRAKSVELREQAEQIQMAQSALTDARELQIAANSETQANIDNVGVLQRELESERHARKLAAAKLKELMHSEFIVNS